MEAESIKYPNPIFFLGVEGCGYASLPNGVNSAA